MVWNNYAGKRGNMQQNMSYGGGSRGGRRRQGSDGSYSNRRNQNLEKVKEAYKKFKGIVEGSVSDENLDSLCSGINDCKLAKNKAHYLIHVVRKLKEIAEKDENNYKKAAVKEAIKLLYIGKKGGGPVFELFSKEVYESARQNDPAKYLEPLVLFAEFLAPYATNKG